MNLVNVWHEGILIIFGLFEMLVSGPHENVGLPDCAVVQIIAVLRNELSFYLVLRLRRLR